MFTPRTGSPLALFLVEMCYFVWPLEGVFLHWKKDIESILLRGVQLRWSTDCILLCLLWPQGAEKLSNAGFSEKNTARPDKGFFNYSFHCQLHTISPSVSNTCSSSSFPFSSIWCNNSEKLLQDVKTLHIHSDD